MFQRIAENYEYAIWSPLALGLLATLAWSATLVDYLSLEAGRRHGRREREVR